MPFTGKYAIMAHMATLANILHYAEIVLAIILITAIMLQRSGAELGGALGGGGDSFHYTRRGFEKFLFNLTIVCGILFALSALFQILLQANG